MTELLLQSALSAAKSKHLATEAAQIRTNCLAQHGDNQSLLSCPECYGRLLEAFRARYLSPTTATTTSSSSSDQQEREWFTARRTFLSRLDSVLAAAREYQVPPQAVDDRVREERAKWYAERVRGSLLRLMAEDPAGRGAVSGKLEDLSSAAADTSRLAGLAGLGGEIAEVLRRGPLAVLEEKGMADLPGRLAGARDQEGRVEVLREAFFTAEDGSVPGDHQKYLDMLVDQRLSMEQVVDRILEERRAAAGAREQMNKLSQRLDELRRARAAHELQKSKKAQRRESLAQQRVPDELYELPACAVCGAAPSTKEFFCCSICAVLAGTGAQQQPTVFCSRRCEEEGHASHAKTHTCSSASECVQLRPKPPPGATDGQDVIMQDETPPGSSDLRFCTECLTTLKQPAMWCSLGCADANFQRHREEVHLPERKKLGLSVDDEAQLEYDNVNNSNRGYRARDLRALTTSLEDAAREWEGKNRVRLQGVD
ncbi:hypothetical protein VTK56DRAFT_8661 [Thermocarpiscus australiensis]